MNTERKRRIVVLTSYFVVITAAVALLFVFRTELWRMFSTPERIEATIDRSGLIAPIAFMAVQFVQVVIFIIPGDIVQIAGGYLFGIGGGILFSIIGITLGSAFNFYLARIFGIPFLRYLFKEEQLAKFERITHSPRAQIAFFLLFVIPGIPKDILCYVAGLSPLKFVAFLLISATGRLPGIIGSAGMGNAAASKEWVVAIVIFAVAVVLFIAGLRYRERIHVFIERFVFRDRDLTDGSSRGPRREPDKPGEERDA